MNGYGTVRITEQQQQELLGVVRTGLKYPSSPVIPSWLLWPSSICFMALHFSNQ